jgi:hypothetical protein
VLGEAKVSAPTEGKLNLLILATAPTVRYLLTSNKKHQLCISLGLMPTSPSEMDPGRKIYATGIVKHGVVVPGEIINIQSTGQQPAAAAKARTGYQAFQEAVKAEFPEQFAALLAASKAQKPA